MTCYFNEPTSPQLRGKIGCGKAAGKNDLPLREERVDRNPESEAKRGLLEGESECDMNLIHPASV